MRMGKLQVPREWQETQTSQIVLSLLFPSLYRPLQLTFKVLWRGEGGGIPSNRRSISPRTTGSKTLRSRHTLNTLRNLFWTSAVLPRYAISIASAITPENVRGNSSFFRARDCCTTSLARYTRFSLRVAVDAVTHVSTPRTQEQGMWDGPSRRH